MKTVVEPNDVKMDDIERLLRRYNLLQIGRPQKLDAKTDSLAFRDIENADVYYMDFVIGVPMSAYILQQELRAALNLPEKFLVVRADNEPVEVYSSENNLLRKLDQKARDAGYDERASLLSTDRHYLDAEQPLVKDAYGDNYNMKLLGFLRKVADNRRTETFQTSSDLNNVAEIQATKRQPAQDTADFNAGFKGPKPVYGKPKSDDEPIEAHYVAPDGNFDDDTKKYFRNYKDARGQRRAEVMTTDPVRKPTKGKKQ
jgi:hypothetical protein